MEIGIYIAIILMSFLFQLLRKLSGKKKSLQQPGEQGGVQQSNDPQKENEENYFSEWQQEATENFSLSHGSEVDEKLVKSEVTHEELGDADEGAVLNNNSIKQYASAIYEGETKQKNDTAHVSNNTKLSGELAAPVSKEMLDVTSQTDISFKSSLSEGHSTRRKKSNTLRDVRRQLSTVGMQRRAVLLAEFLGPPLAARKNSDERFSKF